MSLEEITIDKLFNEKIIIKQYKKGYRFSVDSPILADFVYEGAPQPPKGGVFSEGKGDQGKVYLEIGAGSGIIPILMSFF